ncbi:hypothetical protein ANAEL_01034 [Anaerolineales bacterium]|nr:hypothetical protein ANAEL_01034 [Anaerolineales bacterium]
MMKATYAALRALRYWCEKRSRADMLDLFFV